MTLAQFTEPKLLVPRLLSTHRESAIIELSKRLESAKRIENADSFVGAVLEHEALASAMFDGVAFALARGRAIKELSFALGLAPQPIRWGLGSAAPVVHTVILFAVPLSEGQHYLSLVLTFSSFLKDEMAVSALGRCVQPEEMLTVLNHVRVVRTTIRSNAGNFVGPES
jgi:mannitol/fructose-specific phosphotransferase system IIA component (Ntr-type)